MAKVIATLGSRISRGGEDDAVDHVLNRRNGMRVAVVVNDMSEMNIESQLDAPGGAASGAART
jgi:G3E family GTPase